MGDHKKIPSPDKSWRVSRQCVGRTLVAPLDGVSAMISLHGGNISELVRRSLRLKLQQLRILMNSKIIALALALLSPIAFGHSGVELGPNGGRILELSKNETLHGEVSLKDGNFHMALLDKNMKPAEIGDRTVTVTSGDRNKPSKLKVEKQGDHFVFPVVKEGEWVIVQLRESAKASPVTARFQYDPSECAKCKSAEWLCKCSAEKK